MSNDPLEKSYELIALDTALVAILCVAFIPMSIDVLTNALPKNPVASAIDWSIHQRGTLLIQLSSEDRKIAIAVHILIDYPNHSVFPFGIPVSLKLVKHKEVLVQ